MANPLSRHSAEGIVNFAIHRRQQMLGELLGTLLGTAWLWATRRRTRRDLDELSDHQLDDIGVTREQARREAGKWFWMP